MSNRICSVFCALISAGCSVLWPYDELDGESGANNGGAAAGELCPGGGWCKIPGTQLSNACPPNDAVFNFHDRCPDSFGSSHGSGIADLKRNRLVLWGSLGGPVYPGNEAYAFDLVAGTLERVTDPTEPIPTQNCSPTNTAPSARNPEDSLAYISD